MRLAYLAIALAAQTAAHAQISNPIGLQPAPAVDEQLQKPEQAAGRKNQKIERIQHEDSGSRIDELRYGGQTQTITVQPKGVALPEYEIAPTDLARARPGDKRDGMGASGGTRMWNFLKF